MQTRINQVFDHILLKRKSPVKNLFVVARSYVGRYRHDTLVTAKIERLIWNVVLVIVTKPVKE